MAATRSYEDPCGIARALDRVGERWALLVVRELILGPKRFTDLREGLPGASPNVLSQRLRELEASGVVRRRPLPPPAAATVYELTAWGRDLEPVVRALARFGSRATPVPKGELSADALMLALETTFDAAASEGLNTRIELRVGAHRFRAHVARKHLELSRGSWEECDATIAAETGALRQVVFGQRDFGHARRAGALRVEGDAAVAARFLTLFRRPTPAMEENRR